MENTSQRQGPRRPKNRRNRRPQQQRSRRHYSKMPRPKPKPTGWQKFLSIVSFGMFGKPAPARKRKKPGGVSEEGETRPAKAPAGSPASGEGGKPPKPISVEVTSGRVYVGNLSYDATESDLVELFGGAGTVVSAEIVCHRRTERSKGYGFVEFRNKADAKRAVEDLHDRPYMGRKLVVSGAKKERPSEAA